MTARERGSEQTAASETEVLLAGFGGQGILMAGKLLAHAAMERGLQVSWLPSGSLLPFAESEIVWPGLAVSWTIRPDLSPFNTATGLWFALL